MTQQDEPLLSPPRSISLNAKLSSLFSSQIPPVILLMSREICRPTMPLPEDLNCVVTKWREMWLASCLPLRDPNQDSWSPNTNLRLHPLTSLGLIGPKSHLDALNQNKEDTAWLGLWVCRTITNNSLPLKSYLYLQWAMLPPANLTCQKYDYIFKIYHLCVPQLPW